MGSKQAGGARQDRQPQRYQISVRGRLGPTIRAAFPALRGRASSGRETAMDTTWFHVRTVEVPSAWREGGEVASTDPGDVPLAVLPRLPHLHTTSSFFLTPAGRGCEQAQGTGALDRLAAPVRAELGVQVVQVR